ncbi:hypothetical protein [Streptomyces sp. NPDC059916]|uniref:hypothetical protein n=1 Tax=Streptomyces sp. NPDC059916 TaxID=3347001 RepID=UPI0036A3A35C
MLRIAVADEELPADAYVLDIRHEVLDRLGDPVGCGVRRGAEDLDPARGLFDGGEDVLPLAGQGDGLDEVHGEECAGLGAE